MLSIGIVGLPNVGKSTLFKALTKKQVDISNYPFTTIDPNIGVVAVPDSRLQLLAKLFRSTKIIPTAIEFFDIAGLVKGAATGEGLGNKFLAHIRDVDTIVEVVRVFENEKIIHVHKTIDPTNDIGVINIELILADLETVNKRNEKTRRNDPKAVIEVSAIDKLKNGLGKGCLAVTINLNDKEKEVTRELNLLTDKKFIYAFNVSEDQIKNRWAPNDSILQIIGKNEYVIICGTFELALSDANEEERKIFLEELELIESGLDSLIKKSYKTLDLITFFTSKEDETRAWTAKRGMFIPRAARAIHTDFEQKFIRADAINWQNLLNIGSWSAAKQSGKMRTVGKDYVIQDGDVVEIKI